MKKTVQVTALLFTSALLLAACGQDNKEETTVATTQEPTTQATTAAPTTATPTTATPTTVYSLEDAQKAVFEISDRVGTITMTFYYKDDVLLKQESVENYTLSKIDADNPLELLKNSSAEDEQKYKDLIGKGFEYKSAHNDDIFTVTYSFDYTKTDMKKLKEIEPNLRLTDDNTVSYSEFRDKLLKAGYVEK